MNYDDDSMLARAAEIARIIADDDEPLPVASLQNGSKHPPADLFVSDDTFSLEDMSTCPSILTGTSIVPAASRRDILDDNYYSLTAFLDTHKRPREDDDRKPAAKRFANEKNSSSSPPSNRTTVKGETAASDPFHCGSCETCTHPFVCRQCARCSYSLSCVFSPCCRIDAATLRLYKRQASLLKTVNAELVAPFETIYETNNGVLARNNRQHRKVTAAKSILHAQDRRLSSTFRKAGKEAKSVPTGDQEDTFQERDKGDGVTSVPSSAPPKKCSRTGGRCGSCSSCTNPMECGTCKMCLGHGSRGRCIFALCLRHGYKMTTIAQNRQEAQVIKVGNEGLERQFDLLYGPCGIFANKVKTEPTGRRKNQYRCGTCVSCTTTMKCRKCPPCQRDGACIFHPCLAFDYRESTLGLYKQQAQSIKVGDTSLEAQYERMYGEKGHFAQKGGQRIPSPVPSEVPAVDKASSDRKAANCRNCTSCCSPIVCRVCAGCQKRTKCVFSICQNYFYKGTWMATYKRWAQQACEMSTDKRLKVRFDEIFGKQASIKDHETVTSAPRSGPCSCGDCISCCSPLSCQKCQRCKAKRRCVFDICQNYRYKDSRIVTYKMWAEQALEKCNDDKKLKERFKELFVKGRVRTKAQAATHQIPIGTRVYARWPENNQWYNGRIVSQRRKFFDIKFDDGDVRNGVTRDEFVIKEESAGKTKAVVTDLTISDDENTVAATSNPRNENVEHFLLKKGYYHQWLNREGIVKVAYGTFEACTLADGELKFTVALNLSVGHWVAFGVRNEAPNSHVCGIAEADAWAGYLSFLFQTEGKTCTYSGLSYYLPPDYKPFYRHYIIPTIHSCTQQRTMSLVVKGHHVQLKAKESKIPNCGLGLFITAKPIVSTDSSRASRITPLVLEEGELVDLGVYGPLRPEDLKLDHVLIVKNFVHNWKSENWSFEAKGNNGELIVDITDDATGDLSKVAENNILVYTNETDGIESPTVFATQDPEGAVHYYLGHNHSEHGCLSIPTDGTELELKIDYGSTYESVRVRMGYSRLFGRQLEAEKKNALTYEKDMINELRTLTAEEMFDIEILLEKLISQWTETADFVNMEAVGRALLVTLVLLRQALAISNQADDNSMHRALIQSLHQLSLQFFDQFDFATNRSFIVDNEWYAELLSTTLRLRVVKSIGDNTHSIRKAIEGLIA